MPTLFQKATLTLAGFAPVSALVYSLYYRNSLAAAVLTFCTFAFLLFAFSWFDLLREPLVRRRLLWGYAAGLLATAVYTGARFGLVAMGLFPDLPTMVGDGLADVTNPFWGRSVSSVLLGYVYHFFLNGGLWGAVFVLVFGSQAVPVSGVFFGLLIGGAFCVTRAFDELQSFNASGLSDSYVAGLVILLHGVFGWVLGSVGRGFAFRPNRSSSGQNDSASHATD